MNSSKAGKAEAKAAKREAHVVNLVQRSLRLANVQENRVGGGTPLTELVLVFHGTRGQDIRVFDRHSKQIGVARWSRDKGAKLEGYEIYGTDDEVPLVAINWRTRAWLPGRGGCRVSDSEGIEIATVERLTSTELTPIMVGAQRIGYLKLPGRKPGRVEDIKKREVARIQREACCVTKIEPSLAGPLRTVAAVASIIVGTHPKSSGGGGGAA